MEDVIETPVAKCDTDAVIQKMENISVLKDLRKKVEEGRTALPVSVEAITAEIENQRKGLEEAIAQCGSLEGIPEAALAEAELIEVGEIEPIELEPMAGTPADVGLNPEAGGETWQE